MRKLALTLVPLLLLAACSDQTTTPTASNDQPSFLQGGLPADGNGTRAVFDFSGGPFDIVCNDGQLTRNEAGWGQFREFGQQNNRNVELDVFHFIITYTNADGDRFVWRDVGPDHYYLEGGELFVTVTGRSTASGNIDRTQIVVGHVVLNLSTGEVVFAAGRELGTVNDLACDALT